MSPPLLLPPLDVGRGAGVVDGPAVAATSLKTRARPAPPPYSCEPPTTTRFPNAATAPPKPSSASGSLSTRVAPATYSAPLLRNTRAAPAFEPPSSLPAAPTTTAPLASATDVPNQSPASSGSAINSRPVQFCRGGQSKA